MGGFNGGGSHDSSWGGATDVRLKIGDLNSRIIVAGGGGGYGGGGGGGLKNGNFSNGGGGGSYGITNLTDNGAINKVDGKVIITLIN